MSAAAHHLAQLNVARMLAPIDDPSMADFVAALDPVNALADAAPGFVWRLQTEAGDATSVRVGDDHALLVNMSVWESVAALRAFVAGAGHASVMRRRREWFARPAAAHVVLWWVPAGTVPSLEEATARLALLQERGPTPEAFTFRAPFPPPG